MITKVASIALLTALAGAAQAFPIIERDGSAEFNFKLVNGQCLPVELLDEFEGYAPKISSPTRDGKRCCPASATIVSPKLVPPALWRQLRLFAALPGQPELGEDQLCSAGHMPAAQFAAIKAADDQAERRKQAIEAENNKRPIPPSWTALRSSPHPADVDLVKSIERMKWWDICVAWGREAKAKQLSRRGHALRDNLQHRRLISSIDQKAVVDKLPKVGQTTCGVFGAIGTPDKINTTESATRVREQLVYRTRGIYVYTEAGAGDHNGVVTSIQY